MSVTTQAEVQPAELLQVTWTDGYAHAAGHFTFRVYLESGGGAMQTRTVVITDSTVDLNDICKRIAEGEFGVTKVHEPDGEITLTDENQRTYLVGEWSTDDVTEEDVNIVFEFPTGPEGDTTDKEVSADELSVYNIQRAPDPSNDE